MKTLSETETTPRGFEIVRFQDTYGEPCSVQASSAILEQLKPGTSALWIGQQATRMHLSREQVQALINHLQAWLNTDSLKP